MFEQMRKQSDTETIELDLLLEAMRRRRGYDFRQYARSSPRRRLASRLAVVRDPATAQADAMLPAAMDAVDVDHVLNLEETGRFLGRIRVNAGLQRSQVTTAQQDRA